MNLGPAAAAAEFLIQPECRAAGKVVTTKRVSVPWVLGGSPQGLMVKASTLWAPLPRLLLRLAEWIRATRILQRGPSLTCVDGAG